MDLHAYGLVVSWSYFRRWSQKNHRDRGRITRFYDLKKPTSGITVDYAEDRGGFTFNDSPVDITVDLSWARRPDGSAKIRYGQQNNVPEQKVNGTKYPAQIIKKAFTISLRAPGAGEYSWLEEDGRSSYVCTQFDETAQPKYQTILDGHTSDASPETTAWDAATWSTGGRIEYQGDSLSTADPLVNVVNYYILSSWFSFDAWNEFGPSLFGIPIR